MDFRGILEEGVTVFMKILIPFEILKYSLKSSKIPNFGLGLNLGFEWQAPSWNAQLSTNHVIHELPMTYEFRTCYYY